MTIVYDVAADFNRLPWLALLSERLRRTGSLTAVLLERYHLRHDGVVIDNLRSISAYIPQSLVNHTYLLERTEPAVVDQRRDKSFWLELLADEEVPDCIVWNGGTRQHAGFIDAATQRGCNIGYLEKGWLPQRGTLSLDFRGVGGQHSLTEGVPALSDRQISETRAWLKGRNLNSPPGTLPLSILVPLQLEHDLNIVRDSPFKTMTDFLIFLDNWLPQDSIVTVRTHPLANICPQMPARFQLSQNAAFLDDLRATDMVVGINSTCLVEAVGHNFPVIAFGEGVFSKSPAVMSLTQGDTFPGLFQLDQTARLKLIGNLLCRYQFPQKSLKSMSFIRNHPQLSRLLKQAIPLSQTPRTTPPFDVTQMSEDPSSAFDRVFFRTKVLVNKYLAGSA